MADFAVIKGTQVINRIAAEDLETAESITGETCVPCDGTSMVGGTYVDSKFYAQIVEEE